VDSKANPGHVVKQYESGKLKRSQDSDHSGKVVMKKVLENRWLRW